MYKFHFPCRGCLSCALFLSRLAIYGIVHTSALLHAALPEHIKPGLGCAWMCMVCRAKHFPDPLLQLIRNVFSNSVIKGNPTNKIILISAITVKGIAMQIMVSAMNCNSDAAMTPAELTSHGQRHPVDAQHVLKQK